MILIFEQDTRNHCGKPVGKNFIFKPIFFKGLWRNKYTWRIGWGFWSLSYYPEPGLKDFFDHVSETQWYYK